jgi:hypothetical protein
MNHVSSSWGLQETTCKSIFDLLHLTSFPLAWFANTFPRHWLLCSQIMSLENHSLSRNRPSKKYHRSEEAVKPPVHNPSSHIHWKMALDRPNLPHGRSLRLLEVCLLETTSTILCNSPTRRGQITRSFIGTQRLLEQAPDFGYC